jgi:predicted regulator of Ras-like GTPase activity (Roadblock/LC7/MglB family)
VGQVRSEAVDAPTALTELLELSTQVVEAVVVGPDGIEASSTADDVRAERLAATAASLLEAASDVRPGAAPVDRVVVELPTAAVVVLRGGQRSIVATTVAEPTVGLVAYDLRSVLRRLDEPVKPARRPRKKDA